LAGLAVYLLESMEEEEKKIFVFCFFVSQKVFKKQTAKPASLKMNRVHFWVTRACLRFRVHSVRSVGVRLRPRVYVWRVPQVGDPMCVRGTWI